jgi:dTDP-4-dehydrorhamnose reductase
MNKIMITGASGKLGSALVRVFPSSLHPSHSDLELSDREAVFNYILKHRPSIVIHAAALTGVRECEQDRPRAWKSNVLGTGNLVDACLKHNDQVYFAYVSTACVFDGHRGFYTEEDIPYPENFYSLTKLLGEFVVKKLPNYLIIRTNFVAKEKWRFPKAFTDRFGTYLFAEDVAKGIDDVLKARLQGIVHICGSKKLSMLELARLTTPDVQPMTMSEYNGPRLTVDMTLDTVRWKKYDISLPNYPPQTPRESERQ